MTVKAAADALEWSTPKIWRIETGATSMRSLDAEAMCRVYGASPEMTEALMGLAKETKGRGWWHSYGDAIPEWFELYVGLEAAAVRLAHLRGAARSRACSRRRLMPPAFYEAARPDMAAEESSIDASRYDLADKRC